LKIGIITSTSLVARRTVRFAGSAVGIHSYGNAGDKPQPFNGYYFQILTRQGGKAAGVAKDYIVAGKMTGGFAILSYPAEYKNSGIMTLIVSKDGTVYQKDLGEKTAEVSSHGRVQPRRWLEQCR
jgi:hypothetical protein